MKQWLRRRWIDYKSDMPQTKTGWLFFAILYVIIVFIIKKVNP